MEQLGIRRAAAAQHLGEHAARLTQLEKELEAAQVRRRGGGRRSVDEGASVGADGRSGSHRPTPTSNSMPPRE